jgi:DNA-binding MarR family transcriptional regulator
MTGEITFREVKELTNSTDGNLSVHISKLEEARYLSINKNFFPRTRYNLTEKGKKSFVDYVNILDNFIKQSL